MKRKTILVALLLPFALLTSCSEAKEDSLTIVTRKYDNGKSFEEVSKSKDDDTKIYMTVLSISNRGENDVTFLTSDFKMTIEKNEYTPLFFVKSTYSSSFISNGVTYQNYYVAETSDTFTCKVNESEMENLVLAFETYTEDVFKIEYKGKEVSSTIGY